MSRRRGLSEEDHALWEAVKRTVKPLRAERRPLGHKAPPITAPPAAPPPPGECAAPEPRRAPPTPPPRPVPFDRRLARDLKRGTEAPDRRIDLHGLTQEAAHAALLAFLVSAQASGARVVLVITGKGRDGTGVLRRAVPHWLSGAAFRGLVVSVRDAHAGHGGEGALYVQVKRPKP